MRRLDSAATPASQRPEPLIVAEADLRSFDWFPLYHKRLRRSAFWTRASDAVKARSIDLWCEAYEQVPAGSLPDDDAELSNICGLGRRDLASWLELKAEVMSAWTLCSDGRWYHPTLCEVAAEAWIKRIEAKERERLRKANYRAKSADKSGDDQRPAKPAKASKAKAMSQTGEGQERKPEETPPKGGEGGDAELALSGGESIDPVDSAIQAYVDLALECGLPGVRSVNETLRKKIAKRIKEDGGMETWLEALQGIRVSAHCRGLNDRGWKADLVFLTQDKSWGRLLSGFYGQDFKEGADGQGTRVTTGGREDERDRSFERMHHAALEAAHRPR